MEAYRKRKACPPNAGLKEIQISKPALKQHTSLVFEIQKDGEGFPQPGNKPLKRSKYGKTYFSEGYLIDWYAKTHPANLKTSDYM